MHSKSITLNNLADQGRSVIALCLVCLIISASFLFLTAEIGYCSSTQDPAENIQNAVISAVNNIYRVMQIIATPLCIVFYGYAGLQFFFGGNQGTEKARKVIINTSLGVAFILLAPLLAQAFATWFMGDGLTDVNNFNPLKPNGG